MSVDLATFKISFLVADMVSGRFNSSPLPELTSDEIEQLRQQLVQAKNALIAENESPDESHQANCPLNQEMARLDEIERGEGEMELTPLAAGGAEQQTIAKSEVRRLLPRLEDDFEDSESLYEDASSVSDTSAVDGSSENGTRANPPTPADPVLNLLEQASALLRERPDVVKVSEAPSASNHIPQTYHEIQPVAISRDINQSFRGHKTSFMSFNWKMPPFWMTALIIWCVWATWSQVGSIVTSFDLLTDELQGFRNKMTESVLGCLDDLALAYLSWHSSLQVVEVIHSL